MKSITSRQGKREIELAASPCVMKKPRSNRLHKRRQQISPVLGFPIPSQTERLVSSISVDSTSESFFENDVSSRELKRSFNGSKRKLDESEASDSQFRRVTRSFAKQNEVENVNEMEVSEVSCVESSSRAEFGITSSSLKKENRQFKGIEISESEVVSGISCVEQFSDARNLKLKDNDLVSVDSGAEFNSSLICGGAAKSSENRALIEAELSETSKLSNVTESNASVFNAGSAVKETKKPESLGIDSDLTCTESFSYDEYSDSAFSALPSESFPEESSDYTPSVLFDSGSEFSEKSEFDSTPSPTYSLFLDFKKQFMKSSFEHETNPLLLEEDDTIKPTLARFDDEEDEYSYQRLRERERRQMLMHDYVEDYFSITEHGDLVQRQRSRMVRWIVEQCSTKELQQETLFLGVSLLDRFLSTGFFKSERPLQIVGISCLALATRIEENQPYNSVQQMNFRIEYNKYSRSEVVAMEWLVLEVLKFQCFFPTIYNFLWFYLKAASADADIEKKVNYMAVLALSDHELLCYWPSTIAAGLVILASTGSNQDVAYKRVIETHIRTKETRLAECVKRLERLLPYIN